MPRRLLLPVDELAVLQHRSAVLFADAVRRIVRAGADSTARDGALRNLASLLAATEGMADMLGRRRVLLELDVRLGRRVQTLAFAEDAEDSSAPMIPAIPFEDALARIADADPRLAGDAEEVAALYTTDRYFAMARSISLTVTRKVRDVVARSIREGVPTETVLDVIEAAGPWTRAYAETVYRTNLTTAYSAGRFAEARSPELREFVGGFRYTAVGDVDTRPNHQAADGIYAATDDPIWLGPNGLRPPLGYNCRCALELATRDDMRAAGMIGRNGEIRPARRPRGAFPDLGFRSGGRSG